MGLSICLHTCTTKRQKRNYNEAQISAHVFCLSLSLKNMLFSPLVIALIKGYRKPNVINSFSSSLVN